jgi:hypothetical protein
MLSVALFEVAKVSHCGAEKGLIFGKTNVCAPKIDVTTDYLIKFNGSNLSN